jgi:excinuclease UvrABC nuclease subunit
VAEMLPSKTNLNPLELTLEDIYALPNDWDGPGIYFLWRGMELLYIGASAEVMNRITRQVQLRNQPYCMTGKPQIPFTHWTILGFKTITEAAKVEKDLINKWQPGFNGPADQGDHVWSRHFEAEARAARTTGEKK